VNSGGRRGCCGEGNSSEELPSWDVELKKCGTTAVSSLCPSLFLKGFLEGGKEMKRIGY